MIAAPKHAGEFRTRLMLQRAIENDDGQGGVVRSYVDMRKIWARVTPLRPREDDAAENAGAVQRVRIDTRMPLNLSLRHRLVDGAKIYRIVSYRAYEFITIEAEVQVV